MDCKDSISSDKSDEIPSVPSKMKEKSKNSDKEQDNDDSYSTSRDFDDSYHRRRPPAHQRDRRRSHDYDYRRQRDRDRERDRSRDGHEQSYRHSHHKRSRSRTPEYRSSSSKYSHRRPSHRDRDKNSSFRTKEDRARFQYKKPNPTPPTVTGSTSDTARGEEGDNSDDNDNCVSSTTKPFQLPPQVTAAGASLVQQVEKRKLLFSKKDKPTEAKASSSSSVWQSTKFSDGKDTAKFKRLMGIKSEESASSQDEGGADTKDKEDGSLNSPKDSRKEYFDKLERQYEVARTITHTQRGVGLGFSSAAKPI